MSESRIVVAVGVIADHRGKYLLACRPEDKDFSGWWEFPGGKLDANESVKEALCRELKEELGIEVFEAEPLGKVNHDYPDRRVCLDTWLVTRFGGSPHGREGQVLKWLSIADIRGIRLLDGGWPILEMIETRVQGNNHFGPGRA